MTRRILISIMLIVCSFFVCSKETMTSVRTTSNNINYHLSADGVLTISGTGEVTCLDDDERKERYGIRRKDVKKIVISRGITSIGEYGCCDYTNVREIEMADSVRTMGASAFERCSKLKTIKLSANLDEISAFTFDQCVSLETVTGLACSKIGEYAFSGCTKLHNFELPDKVTSIGEKAFYGCHSLTKFTFPKELDKLGKKALSSCPRLKTITNRSAREWDLQVAKGARTWYCGKKKVTKVASGKTVKAVAKKYKIKYHLNGGSMLGKVKTIYRYGTGIKANQMPKAVRNGYRFVGWSNVLSPGTDYVSIGEIGAKTFHAIWMKCGVKTIGGGKVKVTAEASPEKEARVVWARYSTKKNMSGAKILRFDRQKKEATLSKLKKGKRMYFQFAAFHHGDDDMNEYADWKFKQSVVVK